MKLEEAIKRLEFLIICEKCRVSGKYCDNNCSTQYDAGTVGECIEAMETVVNWAKKNCGSEQERWLKGE